MDEIEKVYKPTMVQANKNIDMGGKRMIKEIGYHNGDYGSWFDRQNKAFKVNVVGPSRYKAIEAGHIKFKDLVDRKTGKLIPLNNLGLTRIGELIEA